MPGRRRKAATRRSPDRRSGPPAALALLHALVAHSSDAVTLLDETGTVTYISEAATRLLGYTVEELRGINAFGLIHADDVVHAQQLFGRLLAEPGAPITAEVRCRHKDGSYRLVEATGVNRLDEPAVGAIVANWRDITDRKRSEAALKSYQGLLKQVIDADPNLVFVKDWDGKFALANKALAEAYGTTSEALVGKSDADFNRNPAEVAHFLRDDREVMTTLQPKSIPEESVTNPSTGETRWFQTVKVPLAGASGTARQVLGVATDITDRKRAEGALRHSEERYRSLVEGVRDLIFALSPSGEVTSLNPAFEEITGFPPSAWIGRPFEALVHPEDVPAALELFGRVVRGETRPTNQFRIVTKAGPYRVAEFSASAQLREGKLIGILGIGRDVTDRLGLEQQLRQAQKMEAVGQLAGGIAHDFNNILTAITGHAELLLQDLGSADPRREDVAEIRRSAERAAGLTRQLLAFSRQQVLQPKVVDLNALVMDMDKLLRRLIGEDVELATVLEPSLGRVKADPGQLEQVIVNLAVNARDAMPTGGKLTLETRNIDLDANYTLEHSPVKPGPYVQLTVSDSGIGMDEETQARIFEPFFTTKPRGQGTGLGLATVYGTVKQSGGFIWVYSEPGHGATFKIYLPRVDAPVEAGVPPTLVAEPLGGSETVLLAEDEPAVRAIARQALERQGYKVIAAPNGAEALALAAQHGATIDLLLTDVVMPGMSGRDLAERLLAQRPGIRVLYISGYTDNAIVRHGMLEPGLAYLQKPFRPDALVRKVREVLDATPPSS
jgi:two-component system cell cycle sensor histidine kinase/response regulator CckA